MNAINISTSKEKAAKEIESLYKKRGAIDQKIIIAMEYNKPIKRLENQFDYITQKIEQLSIKNYL